MGWIDDENNYLIEQVDVYDRIIKIKVILKSIRVVTLYCMFLISLLLLPLVCFIVFLLYFFFLTILRKCPLSPSVQSLLIDWLFNSFHFSPTIFTSVTALAGKWLWEGVLTLGGGRGVDWGGLLVAAIRVWWGLWWGFGWFFYLIGVSRRSLPEQGFALVIGVDLAWLEDPTTTMFTLKHRWTSLLLFIHLSPLVDLSPVIHLFPLLHLPLELIIPLGQLITPTWLLIPLLQINDSDALALTDKLVVLVSFDLFQVLKDNVLEVELAWPDVVPGDESFYDGFALDRGHGLAPG